MGYTLQAPALLLISQIAPDLQRIVLGAAPHWNIVQIEKDGGAANYPFPRTFGIGRRELMTELYRAASNIGVSVVEERIGPARLIELRTEFDLVVVASGENAALLNDIYASVSAPSSAKSNRYLWTKVARQTDAIALRFLQREGWSALITEYPIGPAESSLILECGSTFDAEVPDQNEYQQAIINALVSSRYPDIVGWVRGARWRENIPRRASYLAKENVVFIGDAAFSFHYSLGVGLFYAMESARVLAIALASSGDVPTALSIYRVSVDRPFQRIQTRSVARMNWLIRTLNGGVFGSLEALHSGYEMSGSGLV
ncbi:hypothetical protein [Mesorhizobium sp. CO1-1-4]|uniref:hypothetical protein n=1 Tax=Mesorhizobium sp. CO1-1-4 TaxID=2876633 RepID=UPI001CD008EB|nr:hypothetical protein [Mesorhizobium sp. CO1-1-4]MBZ9740640.1 hypothetical protein [Mesorhizobium sp. CO1-1-4]